jgi:alpha-beta hydrolase superfamily lysophospholipase
LRISSFNSSRLRAISLTCCVALLLAGCAGQPAEPLADTGPGNVGGEMFQAPDGVNLPMRSWLPAEKPRAIIVALHGFADYSVSFARPARLWAASGIATFAFDQRGFGAAPHIFRWSGADTMAADAKAAVRAVRARYPGVPLYLLGESMGGAVAIVATTGAHPADVDGAILVAPAVWEHDLLGSVERSALWVANLTVPSLWLEPPRGLGIHPSNNIEMLRAMARDSLVQRGARADTTAGLMDLMDLAGGAVKDISKPTLVLFGTHEEVLPHKAVTALLGHLPTGSARVAVYPKGYHMLLRDLDGDVVSRDILAWVLETRTKLPSGDECKGAAAGSPPCRNGV